MSIKKISQEILAPEDEFTRTAALRALVDGLKAVPETRLPPELTTFLAGHETRDPVQAALIGLALHALGAGGEDAAFARMFPVLDNRMQPALADEVRQAMAGQDIVELYEKATDLALNSDPDSAEHHYGFLVLSGVDPDRLR